MNRFISSKLVKSLRLDGGMNGCVKLQDLKFIKSLSQSLFRAERKMSSAMQRKMTENYVIISALQCDMFIQSRRD